MRRSIIMIATDDAYAGRLARNCSVNHIPYRMLAIPEYRDKTLAGGKWFHALQQLLTELVQKARTL